MEQKMMKYPILPMWQPYASLTLHQNPNTGLPYKQWETRPNKPPKTILGKTILIHACAKWDIDLAFMSLKKPFRTALNNIMGMDIANHPLFLLDKGKPKRGSDKLPFGAIIGSWEIEGFGQMQEPSKFDKLMDMEYDVKSQPLMNIVLKEVLSHTYCHIYEPEYSFGDYRAARWGWEIKNHRLLKEPIPNIGKQGIQYIELDPERLQYI